MDILQRGPQEAKPAQHGQVVHYRDFEEVNHRAVQQQDEERLKSNPTERGRVKRFLECSRRTIQVGFPREPFWIDNGDQIAEDDHQPKQPGEDPIKLKVFPNRIFAIKIQVEGFIVGAVAQVVAQMPLAAKMKRSREEQRHNNPGDIIDLWIWVKSA